MLRGERVNHVAARPVKAAVIVAKAVVKKVVVTIIFYPKVFLAGATRLNKSIIPFVF
jgi:hypothetical protein